MNSDNFDNVSIEFWTLYFYWAELSSSKLLDKVMIKPSDSVTSISSETRMMAKYLQQLWVHRLSVVVLTGLDVE